jgi:hypothetical protein
MSFTKNPFKIEICSWQGNERQLFVGALQYGLMPSST